MLSLWSKVLLKGIQGKREIIWDCEG